MHNILFRCNGLKNLSGISTTIIVIYLSVKIYIIIVQNPVDWEIPESNPWV